MNQTLEKGQPLTTSSTFEALEEFGDDFVPRMGAEASLNALSAMDSGHEKIAVLREKSRKTNLGTKIKKLFPGALN